MEGKSPHTMWVEKIFDVSEPYLYILVLPALVMFALGFRTQAIVFALGAAVFFTITSMA